MRLAMGNMRYHKRSDVVVQGVEGEVLLLDMKGNKLHQLNQTATLLWDAMDGEMSVADLAALLVDKFGIDEAQALNDVSRTMEVLREAGLVEKVSAGEDSSSEDFADVS